MEILRSTIYMTLYMYILYIYSCIDFLISNQFDLFYTSKCIYEYTLNYTNFKNSDYIDGSS